ncbi:CHAT domain-containing tetratricopeptide repeat protein [Paucibacter sp. Y2R2-4]|uniref:CHAT domain-containing tetratricopeptide repeat protein n=1 Tax=Paucibacter sp. Y2R2-4 TaxID=2893553 RepID=UPI0021E3BD41|nr:tetratricopeptide repeat protein [Paucibacter sp. Y2R2-4]MCV2350805.1 tetratricopeptide repeat protein [Paucibacter sp. Y2R2-4]
MADVATLNGKVFQLYSQGRYAEAMDVARQALAEAEVAYGPEHASTATTINNLAVLCREMGRYEEALPLYKRALAINEKAIGPEHPDTAVDLNNLGLLYKTMGRYSEALSLYKRALAITEKASGPDHVDTARGLNNVAGLYVSVGHYDEALPLYRRALSIVERAFGPNHERTSTVLNNLAGLYESTGRYGDALPLYKRAIAITEKVLGPEHASNAAGLNNLAGLYQSMGRYEEALPLYKRALAIDEKALGPEHPNTAIDLNNLAHLYVAMGRYDDALPLYKSALAITEKSLGPDHTGTATSLNNLASFYLLMDRYAEGLPLFRRALAINEKALGPDHAATAASLNNLAQLYESIGRFDESLPLYKRALAITDKALGIDHASTATSLNNLAGLYALMGRFDEALPLYKQALAINEKVLGPDHVSTATSLNNLAGLYVPMGRYDQASPLYKRALAITENSLGPNHESTATRLNNLARLYESIGRYDEALPLYLRALAVTEKALGLDHVSTATSLNNLAGLYLSMGRYDDALPLYRRAVRSVLVTNIVDPERNQRAINELAVFSSNLAFALDKRQDGGALDEAIFYFKLSVNTRQRMRAGTRGLDAATRESFTKKLADPYRALSALLIQRGRIAEAERVLLLLKESELTEYLRRNGGAGSGAQNLTWTAEEDAYRQDLDRVAGEWRDFERRRAAVADAVKAGRASSTGPEMTDLDERRLQLDTRTRNIMEAATQRFVAASRQANERRLQAFDSARTELSAKLTELRERGDGGLKTAGLLLLPGARGLTLILTTEQGAVPLIAKVSETELDALVKALRDAIQARKDYRAPAQALYQHLIAPAEAQLKNAPNIRQWAILPFGNLRALPFAALMRPDGTHLVEHYAVSILTADGSGKLEGLETPTRDLWRGVALGASQSDAEFGSVALPGVRREVCGVIREVGAKDCRADEGMISGQRYLDAAFTPELLQRLLGPAGGGASFLHIATHFKVEKSLLLLGDGSKLSTGQILGWTPRLGQYDLIALSACESGVSEGALDSLGGLFRSKGAKAVLATLWPVADVGAAPLMMEFYRQRGEKRSMSKAAALQQAQLGMLKGAIKDEAASADLRHPYFWAPYVLMGNWL